MISQFRKKVKRNTNDRKSEDDLWQRSYAEVIVQHNLRLGVALVGAPKTDFYNKQQKQLPQLHSSQLNRLQLMGPVRSFFTLLIPGVVLTRFPLVRCLLFLYRIRPTSPHTPDHEHRSRKPGTSLGPNQAPQPEVLTQGKRPYKGIPGLCQKRR